MLAYELSGSRFESSCSHLNFRFGACFEQGVPWHSGNYRVLIHSAIRKWHDKNIQSIRASICWLIFKYGWAQYACFHIICIFRNWALPLGLVITSDEQMETLTVAFSLLKSIFPDRVFLGKKRQFGILEGHLSTWRTFEHMVTWDTYAIEQLRYLRALYLADSLSFKDILECG